MSRFPSAGKARGSARKPLLPLLLPLPRAPLQHQPRSLEALLHHLLLLLLLLLLLQLPLPLHLLLFLVLERNFQEVGNGGAVDAVITVQRQTTGRGAPARPTAARVPAGLPAASLPCPSSMPVDRSTFHQPPLCRNCGGRLRTGPSWRSAAHVSTMSAGVFPCDAGPSPRRQRPKHGRLLKFLRRGTPGRCPPSVAVFCPPVGLVLAWSLTPWSPETAATAIAIDWCSCRHLRHAEVPESRAAMRRCPPESITRSHRTKKWARLG